MQCKGEFLMRKILFSILLTAYLRNSAGPGRFRHRRPQSGSRRPAAGDGKRFHGGGR
jgi:hypothetical protein